MSLEFLDLPPTLKKMPSKSASTSLLFGWVCKEFLQGFHLPIHWVDFKRYLAHQSVLLRSSRGNASARRVPGTHASFQTVAME